VYDKERRGPNTQWPQQRNKKTQVFLSPEKQWQFEYRKFTQKFPIIVATVK
jgi:hypothetical protein